MFYNSADDWNNAAHKHVALFGMSGLGKTYLSNILRAQGDWFHYSVDYRIGTRYMGEHIVDNFKAEAMRNPFLAKLLRSDSIYIGSNITFENLTPLSTYLGKPGDPAKGGIAFSQYRQRQRQHRVAEIAAMQDTVGFIERAQNIYNYSNFVCDTSGSMVEVVDPNNPDDPVLSNLAKHVLPVWIRGNDSYLDALVERFSKAPKPMYYQEDFLINAWGTYLKMRQIEPDQVDPDDFISWGYRQLLTHRLPRYGAIAPHWGVTVEADDVATVRTAEDFHQLIARILG